MGNFEAKHVELLEGIVVFFLMHPYNFSLSIDILSPVS